MRAGEKFEKGIIRIPETVVLRPAERSSVDSSNFFRVITIGIKEIGRVETVLLVTCPTMGVTGKDKMQNYQFAECAYHGQNGSKCGLSPRAHGVEKGRGAEVAHPFVLGVTRPTKYKENE